MATSSIQITQHTTSSRSPLSRSPTRRPKLLRSSATVPSLATTYASRNLATIPSPPRATALLTRVAYHSEKRSAHEPTSGSNESPQFSANRRGLSLKDGETVGRDKSGYTEKVPSESESYFSFPSFDDFSGPAAEEGKPGTDQV